MVNMVTQVIEPTATERAHNWMNGSTLEYLQSRQGEIKDHTAQLLPKLIPSVTPETAPFAAGDAVGRLTKFVAETELPATDGNVPDDESYFRKIARRLTQKKYPTTADSADFGPLIQKLFYLKFDEDRNNPLMHIRDALCLTDALGHHIVQTMDDRDSSPLIAAAIGNVFSRIDDAIEAGKIYSSQENSWKQQAVRMVAEIVKGAAPEVNEALRNYATSLGEKTVSVKLEAETKSVLSSSAVAGKDGKAEFLVADEVRAHMPEKYVKMMGQKRFDELFADYSKSEGYTQSVQETKFDQDGKKIDRKIIDEQWEDHEGNKQGRRTFIDIDTTGAQSITSDFYDRTVSPQTTEVRTYWNDKQFQQEISSSRPDRIGSLVQTVPLHYDADSKVVDEYRELVSGCDSLGYTETIQYNEGSMGNVRHFIIMRGSKSVDDRENTRDGTDLNWDNRWGEETTITVQNGVLEKKTAKQPNI